MDALAGLTEKMTSELGLNGEELNICSEREDIKELITSQATAGKMWGVQGTPTIFVNSKKVPSGPLIPFLEAIYSEVKN